ncbi:transposase [Heliobacillus mobilis]|uniref:Transposase n=1 Tax=Heliobacterium mobile TaxID=28064 RepID=A0A6I3SPV3_HELMO|nr:transposase [Heliobacterium mobile]MTV51078.1 transposase [Heliobacterium mobile]
MTRKQYPKEFKEQVIQEARECGNIAQVARRHEVHVNMLYRWIQQSKHKSWQDAPEDAKKVSAYVPSPKEFVQLESENDRLKQLLGEKDLEIAILRDLIKKKNPGYLTKLK